MAFDDTDRVKLVIEILIGIGVNLAYKTVAPVILGGLLAVGMMQ